MNDPLTAAEWFRAAFILFCILLGMAYLACWFNRAITMWFDVRHWRRTSLGSHVVGDVRGFRK